MISCSLTPRLWGNALATYPGGRGSASVFSGQDGFPGLQIDSSSHNFSERTINLAVADRQMADDRLPNRGLAPSLQHIDLPHDGPILFRCLDFLSVWFDGNCYPSHSIGGRDDGVRIRCERSVSRAGSLFGCFS